MSQRLRDDHAQLSAIAAAAKPGDRRLADAHDRIREAERRVGEIDAELAAVFADRVDEADVAATLAEFAGMWDCLAPREQARVVELLVERVAYDAGAGKVAITFRATGVKALASQRQEEAA